MTLRAKLATGELGLVVKAPAALLTDDESALTFNDDAGRHWWWFWKPKLAFDVSAAHRPQLEAHLQHFTRAMFDDLFDEQRAAGKLPGDLQPRTHDATWSPLIEVTSATFAGKAGLWFMHRMLYVQGREVVLSHALIPTAHGTFEARVLTTNGAHPTGLRESVLLLESGTKAFLPQAAYDDAKHDARFPHHPVTLAREARRWLETVVEKVSSPRPAPARHQVKGLATVSLPHGFAPMHDAGVFARSLCCVTDGLEWLLLERRDARFFFFPGRRAEAAARAHFAHRLETEGLPKTMQPHAQGLSGEAPGPARQRARSVMAWKLERGALWTVTLHSSAVRPVEALLDDAAAALATVKVE